MSERDLYYELRPQIFDLAVEASEMSQDQYADWKSSTLEQAKEFGEKAVKFMEKVFVVIEKSTGRQVGCYE